MRLIYTEEVVVIYDFQSGLPPGGVLVAGGTGDFIVSSGGDQITDNSGNSIVSPS